jgi:hypothetical protein
MIPRLRPSERAWLALGVGVLAYDVCAPDGETLSEGVDRWLEAHTWITRVVILTVARHLGNELTADIDPLALTLGLARRLRRQRVVVVVDQPG